MSHACLHVSGASAGHEEEEEPQPARRHRQVSHIMGYEEEWEEAEGIPDQTEQPNAKSQAHQADSQKQQLHNSDKQQLPRDSQVLHSTQHDADKTADSAVQSAAVGRCGTTAILVEDDNVPNSSKQPDQPQLMQLDSQPRATHALQSPAAPLSAAEEARPLDHDSMQEDMQAPHSTRIGKRKRAVVFDDDEDDEMPSSSTQPGQQQAMHTVSQPAAEAALQSTAARPTATEGADQVPKPPALGKSRRPAIFDDDDDDMPDSSTKPATASDGDNGDDMPSSSRQPATALNDVVDDDILNNSRQPATALNDNGDDDMPESSRRRTTASSHPAKHEELPQSTRKHATASEHDEHGDMPRSSRRRATASDHDAEADLETPAARLAAEGLDPPEDDPSHDDAVETRPRRLARNARNPGATHVSIRDRMQQNQQKLRTVCVLLCEQEFLLLSALHAA